MNFLWKWIYWPKVRIVGNTDPFFATNVLWLIDDDNYKRFNSIKKQKIWFFRNKTAALDALCEDNGCY